MFVSFNAFLYLQTSKLKNQPDKSGGGGSNQTEKMAAPGKTNSNKSKSVSEWFQKMYRIIFGPSSRKEKLAALEKIIANKKTNKIVRKKAEIYKNALLDLEKAEISGNKKEIRKAKANVKKAHIQL